MTLSCGSVWTEILPLRHCTYAQQLLKELLGVCAMAQKPFGNSPRRVTSPLGIFQGTKFSFRRMIMNRLKYQLRI